MQNEPPPPRRLLVSQDHHEIYLIFGVFDSGYVRFTQGLDDDDDDDDQDAKVPPLLEMIEYGPFDIRERHHMSTLSKFILAYSRYAHGQREYF